MTTLADIYLSKDTPCGCSVLLTCRTCGASFDPFDWRRHDDGSQTSVDRLIAEAGKHVCSHYPAVPS